MEVKIENKCILFGVCYRPLGQSVLEAAGFLEKLEFSLVLATNKSFDSIILVGDFNDTCTIWNSRHVNSELQNNLVDLTLAYSLKQLIN